MSMKIRTLVGIAALSLAGAASSAHADFIYADMSDTSGLKMVGSASKTGSVIQLTNVERQVAGAVWHTERQNVEFGFDASIVVRVPQTNGSGADGFALVIQNSSNEALGDFGGGIGYGSNSWYPGPGGIPNSIAIELDTYNNNDGAGWPDMPGTHVSVQSRGQLPNSPDQNYSLGAAAVPTIVDGSVHTLRVRYASGIMDVFVDNLSIPKLSLAIDLSTLLALENSSGVGQAFVGVTSATGGIAGASAHQLMAFSFEGNPNVPAPGAAALLGFGGLAVARRRRR